MSEPQRRVSRKRAERTDPWVSVSLLGESLFCARAGRFQYEQSQEDTGEEDDIAPPRRGWYRPPFGVDEIERELAKLGPRIVRRAAISVGGLAATAVGWGAPPLVPLALGIMTFAAVISLAGASFAWLALSLLLARARSADTAEPSLQLSEPQEVSWWSLLRSGFELHRSEDPLSDNAWQLAGKPWRVLHRGSLRVPVFRKRNEDNRLYPQHHARLAAYAHLIERTEGATVPYGLILLGSSYRGLAVPIHPGSKKQFHDGLIRARAIIKAGQDQPSPPNTGRCRSCPWGKPISDNGGRSYASPCGTRYRWVPPHQKAVRKGLVRG